MSSEPQTTEEVDAALAAQREAFDAGYQRGQADAGIDWDVIRQGELLLAKQVEALGFAIEAMGTESYHYEEARDAVVRALVRVADKIQAETD